MGAAVVAAGRARSVRDGADRCGCARRPGALRTESPRAAAAGGVDGSAPLREPPRRHSGPLGLAYLAVGWLRRRTSDVIMGFALAAVAMALEWDATDVVLGWTTLAGAALTLERSGGRPGGRAASVLLETGAFVCLFT